MNGEIASVHSEIGHIEMVIPQMFQTRDARLIESTMMVIIDQIIAGGSMQRFKRRIGGSPCERVWIAMRERQFYSSSDLMEIMGIGRTKAYEMLRMFEARGQLFRDGGLMLVRVSYFDAWVAEREAAGKAKFDRQLERVNRKRARYA